jgi:cardiolipin synthase
VDAVTPATTPAAASPYPLVGGNKVDLLVEYNEWLPQLYEDLSVQRKVINVRQYNWEPSGPGRVVADMLIKQAKGGAEVNVITDRHGSFGTDSEAWRSDPASVNAMFDEMRAAGITVTVNDPKAGMHWWSNPLKERLEHQKVIDIDHQIVHEGGMGWAQSATGTKKYGNWHDFYLRIEGPAAAQFGQEYIAAARSLGQRVTDRNVSLLTQQVEHPAIAGAALVRALPNTPGVRADATDDLYASLRNAKTRFWLTTPYIGEPKLVAALKDAKARGVDVRVLVPGDGVKQNLLFGRLSRSFYEDLVDAQIPVHAFDRMMHGKSWLADDDLTVGSTNASRGSLQYYGEMSASVHDAAVSAKMAGVLEHDFTASPAYTAAQLHDVPTVLLRAARRVLGLWF